MAAGTLLLITGMFLGALLFRHVRQQGQHDFLPFYMGAQLVASGHVADIYNKPPYEPLIAELRSQGVRMSPFNAHYFIRPAFQAFFYTPLTLLPYEKASLLILVGNFAFLLVLIWKLPIWFPVAPRQRLFVRSALALFYPFLWSILVGQDTLLLTFLIAYALYLESLGCDVMAGCLMGICVWKPHLIWLMPLALIAGSKWKMATACLATASILMAVSFACVGASGFRQWLQLVQAPSSDITPYTMGNMRALNLHFGLAVTSIGTVLTLLSFIIVMRRGDLHERFAAAVIAALLLSPHTYWQDYSLVAIIAMLITNPAVRFSLVLPWQYFYSRNDELPMSFLILLVLTMLAAGSRFSGQPIIRRHSPMLR